MEPSLREDLADGPLLGRFNARLRGSLEQRFVRETDAQRDRQIAFWIACELGFTWLMLALDIMTMPELWKLAILTRLCIDTPVALAAIFILRRPGPPWRRSLAAITPPSVMAVAVLVLFGMSNNPDMLRSAFVLSIGVLWINVIVPMRLRDALIFTTIALTAGDLINFVVATSQDVPFAPLDLIVPTHLLVAFSLLSRLVSERQQRHSFVLGLRLQLRAEDLARSNTQLLQMSNTDPLTGLANRRAFDRALTQAHNEAAATKSPLAVIMIDVDHFKPFNDTAGHLEGDRCLTTIAHTIAAQLRDAPERAARFGGEEFVVLMPGANRATAHQTATRIHTAIRALRLPHPARAGNGFVSVSIGVASTADAPPLPTAAALLTAADQALYAAKKAGRDRVTCTEPTMLAASA